MADVGVKADVVDLTDLTSGSDDDDDAKVCAWGPCFVRGVKGTATHD